jgi:prepilin-type processing-associated H-X9-DG protein
VQNSPNGPLCSATAAPYAGRVNAARASLDLLTRRRRLAAAALLLAALAAAGIAAVSVHAASTRRHDCTHGLSSIGPVTFVDGHVVGGSAVAHTEACLR